VRPTFDDGTRCQLTYRQAAQLGFWLKEGQRVEVTGEVRDGILHIATLRRHHQRQRAPRARITLRKGAVAYRTLRTSSRRHSQTGRETFALS